jgi:hypothetical protein
VCYGVLKDCPDHIVHERGQMPDDIAPTRSHIVFVPNTRLCCSNEQLQLAQKIRAGIVAVKQRGK